jgi:hypothetical protein
MGSKTVKSNSKAVGFFLGAALALATLASVVIASRSAVRDFGDFQYNSAHEGSVNFHEFWDSTRALFQGYNIYDPAVFQKFNLLSPYLPNSFVFFFPFTLLSLRLARALWLALNLLFTILLARQISVLFWDKKHFLLLLALICCSAPWGNLIHFGQCTLWALCFFLLALQWDREGRPILSGLAIAFCLLKYFLTAPLLLYFLVYRRSWKNVAVAAGIHAILFGVFCVYLKMSPWDLFRAPFLISKTFGTAQFGFLDLSSFWLRITGKSMGLPYLLSALPVAGAWIWLLNRNRGKDDLGMMALTAMAGLTILYHNLYDFLGAIFPLVWFLKGFPAKRETMVLTVGVVVLWVLYLSSHYLEFFPRMYWLMDLMRGDGYLLFVSLLWYLGLGCLWFQLKAEAPER